MSTEEGSRRPNRASAAARLAAAMGAAAAVAVAPAMAATTAAADGDFGPDTCLNGYVWREAVSSDHVCVVPDVRTQTRQDNALAASRRSPNGGPFGPDTCLQGFVWREAVAGDHVCVLPVTRDRARDDNLHAAERRDELRMTVGTYGLTRYLVQTDRINVGPSRVFLFNAATRKTIRWWSVSAPQHPTAPGGLISVRTGVTRCSGGLNAYFRVQDLSSTRWSLRRYVCARL
jgi:hypothetical protein